MVQGASRMVRGADRLRGQRRRRHRRRLTTCSATLRCRRRRESEKAFQLGFVASLGNVKAFILGICGAVVFAIMLVSANTMAMSVRSRTREVAVLKTLGIYAAARAVDFRERVGGSRACWRSTRRSGCDSGDRGMTHQIHRAGHSAEHASEWSPPRRWRLFVARHPWVWSADMCRRYRASRMNIVEALRHIG